MDKPAPNSTDTNVARCRPCRNLPFAFAGERFLSGFILNPFPFPPHVPRLNIPLALTEEQLREMLDSLKDQAFPLTLSALRELLLHWLPGESRASPRDNARPCDLVLASRFVAILLALATPSNPLLHPAKLLTLTSGGVGILPHGNLHRLLSLLWRIAIFVCAEAGRLYPTDAYSSPAPEPDAAIVSLFASCGPCPAYDLRAWSRAQGSDEHVPNQRPTTPSGLPYVWSANNFSGGVRQCVGLASRLRHRLEPAQGSRYPRFRTETANSPGDLAHNLRAYSEACAHVLHLVSFALRIVGHASWQVCDMFECSPDRLQSVDMAACRLDHSRQNAHLREVVRTVAPLANLNPALLDEFIPQAHERSGLPYLALCASERRLAIDLFDHGWRSAECAWGVSANTADHPSRCGPYLPPGMTASPSPSRHIVDEGIAGSFLEYAFLVLPTLLGTHDVSPSCSNRAPATSQEHSPDSRDTGSASPARQSTDPAPDPDDVASPAVSDVPSAQRGSTSPEGESVSVANSGDTSTSHSADLPVPVRSVDLPHHLRDLRPVVDALILPTAAPRRLRSSTGGTVWGQLLRPVSRGGEPSPPDASRSDDAAHRRDGDDAPGSGDEC